MPGCASDRSLHFDSNIRNIRNWSITMASSAAVPSNGGAYGSMSLLPLTTVMTSGSISAAAISSSSSQVTTIIGPTLDIISSPAIESDTSILTLKSSAKPSKGTGYRRVLQRVDGEVIYFLRFFSNYHRGWWVGLLYLSLALHTCTVLLSCKSNKISLLCVKSSVSRSAHKRTDDRWLSLTTLHFIQLTMIISYLSGNFSVLQQEAKARFPKSFARRCYAIALCESFEKSVQQG
jgi:hypothetical protein